MGGSQVGWVKMGVGWVKMGVKVGFGSFVYGLKVGESQVGSAKMGFGTFVWV